MFLNSTIKPDLFPRTRARNDNRSPRLHRGTSSDNKCFTRGWFTAPCNRKQNRVYTMYHFINDHPS